MPFVLGAMGNEWAWKNKTWDSIEQFHAVQKRWAIAGAIVSAVSIGAIVAGAIFFLTAIKNDTLFVAGLREVQHNQRAIDALGEPIHHGFGFSGTFETTGPTGKADLMMPVEGSKNKGTIYLKGREARRSLAHAGPPLAGRRTESINRPRTSRLRAQDLIGEPVGSAETRALDPMVEPPSRGERT